MGIVGRGCGLIVTPLFRTNGSALMMDWRGRAAGRPTIDGAVTDERDGPLLPVYMKPALLLFAIAHPVKLSLQLHAGSASHDSLARLAGQGIGRATD